MTKQHTDTVLRSLLNELVSFPKETEWVEFKHNNAHARDIGEYISALANSAALMGKPCAYMVWGVEDDSHKIIGTTFKPALTRFKGQELESWLLQKLEPKIDFAFYSFITELDVPISMIEIQAASHTPVRFDGKEYIRIGSYKKPLGKHPEKERALWRVFDRTPFEEQAAKENVTADDVLKLIDYPAYFDLMDIPLPEGRQGIFHSLESDGLIRKNQTGEWDITNMGAVLFARELKQFRHLGRKAVRLILYKGGDRCHTIREIEGTKGYAVGFEGLIDTITTLLPSNEEIGKAFRREVSMYPDIAIRELVPNALIHQDFNIIGAGPMIEIFDDRMEITNPGIPLIDVDRFLDSPPRSRNESIAALMRRMHICEERGSGIDKIVTQTEIYQLPAPLFETYQDDTRAVLFSHREFRDMDSEEKIRATYLHSVLRYLNRQPMTNTTLRERFGIEAKNSAMVSRIIKKAIDAGRIKPYDDSAGPRTMRYVPWWT
ncbi:MAG: putative DNA binding domain-containing protein [Desulfobacterales bacterium]|nr:putative DNA binding domain-containing protein [Desulfobacterales bacterium]